jgi:hypothetical protein
VETRSYPSNSQAILGKKRLKTRKNKGNADDGLRTRVVFTKCVRALSSKGLGYKGHVLVRQLTRDTAIKS